MSQQEHGVAGLALKSADIPENPHERARDVYHLKIAGWALGPIRRRHDALLARGSLGQNFDRPCSKQLTLQINSPEAVSPTPHAAGRE
jgi:hypothetical protein